MGFWSTKCTVVVGVPSANAFKISVSRYIVYIILTIDVDTCVVRHAVGRGTEHLQLLRDKNGRTMKEEL